MNSSDYTEPFLLEHVAVDIDDNGVQKRLFSTVFRGYAKVTNLSGSEYWEAFSQGQESTVKVHTRWNPVFEGLDARKHVLQLRGRRYDIISPPENVGWRNEGCTFKAKARDHG